MFIPSTEFAPAAGMREPQYSETTAVHPIPPFPAIRCLHEGVALQASLTPEETAVVWGGSPLPVPHLDGPFENHAAHSVDCPLRLSYRELDDRANQLAHYLQSMGVGPEVPVGVFLERRVELLVALLGILKAGGAYVPLDPAYPAARLTSIFEDSRAPILLTQQDLLPDWMTEETQVVCLDRDWPQIALQPALSPVSGVTPLNLAYVIYTSGSTGRPKGVGITHGNAVSFLSWASQIFNLADLQGVLAGTSICFDLSIFELFLPLSRGGTVILAEDALAIMESPPAFPITLINTVPSVMAELVRAGAIPETVRTVNLAGEPLKHALIDQIYAVGTVERVYNLYGPTEDTTYSTYALMERRRDDVPNDGRTATGRAGPAIAVGRSSVSGPPPLRTEYKHPPARRLRRRTAASRVRPTAGSPSEGGPFEGLTSHPRGDGRPSIGRSISGSTSYVLDEALNEAPPGEVGELYLGGTGLARGYLHRPSLTAERFVPNPFGPPGSRLYRTGDLARRHPDGQLEFLGRVDHQVKLRGFRIELGEIEATLENHPGIREAVVTALGEGVEQRLVAYLVPERDAPDADDLRHFLQQTLPDYMVPAVFVPLPRMPLTPNGKVDRAALPAPDPVETTAYVAPRSEIESIIAEIWQTALGIERVGVHENFLYLGGHSLVAAPITARIREAFEVHLPQSQLFLTPTVADLAVAVELAIIEELESLPDEASACPL